MFIALFFLPIVIDSFFFPPNIFSECNRCFWLALSDICRSCGELGCEGWSSDFIRRSPGKGGYVLATSFRFGIIQRKVSSDDDSLRKCILLNDYENMFVAFIIRRHSYRVFRRTLCPDPSTRDPSGDRDIVVDVSTSSLTNVNFNINVSIDNNFNVGCV